MLKELKGKYLVACENETTAIEVLETKQEALELEIQNLRSQFAEENSELINLRKDAETAKENCKNELTDSIILTYKENPTTKQLGDGLSVRVVTKLNYDENKAIDWAVKHEMPKLLKINKALFNKQAKLSDFDFVETSENVIAIIGKAKGE